MTSRKKAIRITISGNVQGVGFRYFIAQEAERLKLSGYVENTRDGDVMVCAEGESASIDSLERLCQKGPRGAEVHNVKVEELLSPHSFDGFYIHYSD